MIFHGHFPQTFGGFREEPPDPNLKPEYSDRFHLEGYNRIVQEQAYQFYKEWTGPDFPRMVIIEIQHANPFYDDSYAVNSANVGPYGDAITYELIPYLEKKYRCIGAGWARFLYGGSTGGWEALAVQIFYPTEYNGCYAACPDPIDFRAYTVVDIYKDKNAYYDEGPFHKVKRPGTRNYLGHLSATLEDANLYELVLGTKSRSGQQWDIWEAVYSPVGPDGYPKRIWDKRTGVIDHEVAAYWREHYDLRYILERDWPKIGKQLEGKIHLYVGDMDNFYLNNAVYLTEDFLKKTKNPPYGGEVLYGDRAEHCWNGDREPAQRDQPAALSPNVRAEDRRSTAEDGAGGRRRDELEVLKMNRLRGGATPCGRFSRRDRPASSGRSFWYRSGSYRGSAQDLVPVGVSAVDITPDYPIRMVGYESRKTESTGIASRLKARALAIGGDGTPAADRLCSWQSTTAPSGRRSPKRSPRGSNSRSTSSANGLSSARLTRTAPGA